MEKSNLTKELLAESFRDLLLHRDFEKITIKHITEQAGVIRPTFYYHFQDKYDVLEYILKRDVIVPVSEMIEENGLNSAAVREIFSAFERDRAFYQKAFRVTGQNGFFEILFLNFKTECGKAFEKNGRTSPVNTEMAAMYYAIGLANVVRFWIAGGKKTLSLDEICSFYEYLITHSIYEFMK